MHTIEEIFFDDLNVLLLMVQQIMTDLYRLFLCQHPSQKLN
jgi:hypothetical protein